MVFFKPKKPKVAQKKKEIPAGTWTKCEGCSAIITTAGLQENAYVCPECDYHYTIGIKERMALTIDEGSFKEYFSEIKSTDPIKFTEPKSYKDKLREAQDATGLDEAVKTGVAKINGRDVAIGITDSRFIMGSMGSVLGERICRLFEIARQGRLPVIIISGSGGGARMYEGMFSLMQMAKTSAAVGRYQKSGGVFISVLTNPTMAGVLASFASLGDILVAEPGALIGFTGPRVIKQTIRQELPKGFQRPDFLLDHGLIDIIAHRKTLKDVLSFFLRIFYG